MLAQKSFRLATVSIVSRSLQLIEGDLSEIEAGFARLQ